MPRRIRLPVVESGVSPRPGPMGRRERIRAAAERRPVDRVPYAVWRHFPAVDRSPAGLAQATLRFHERYGSDFLVLLPSEGYTVEAWGCDEADEPGPDGRRPCARCAVGAPADWRKIRPLDPSAPGYAGQLETIIRLGFDRRLGDTPVLVTLLSPLSVAQRLAGGRLGEDLRDHPALVEDALEAIAETTLRFAEAALAEGLAGVFYTIRTATRDAVTEEVYARFGEPHDRRLLEAVRGRSLFMLVHAAGKRLLFDRLAGLPADAWSWDARATPPTLTEGQARVPGAVVGGLDAWRTLRDGTPEAAVLEAEDAIRQTGGIGLVVAPGGALPPNTPDAPVAAVVRALGGPLRPLPGLVA